jgi:type IV secretory pathway TraG/TraD family ATPase VirD4
LLYFGLKDAATINCVADAIQSSGTMNNSKEDIKAELASLDEKECIVMIRGIKPFRNEKMK